MKRLRGFFLAALMMPLSVLAAGTTLVIELNSGQTASFELKDKPVLTMEGTQLKIVTETVQASYERSNVKEFHFTSEGAGIEQVTAKGAMAFCQTDADHLEISGLAAGEHITVSDMGGRQIGAVSRSGNKAVVSLSGQQKGIYLIKVGKSQTIKFIKK